MLLLVSSHHTAVYLVARLHDIATLPYPSYPCLHQLGQVGAVFVVPGKGTGRAFDSHRVRLMHATANLDYPFVGRISS